MIEKIIELVKSPDPKNQRLGWELDKTHNNGNYKWNLIENSIHFLMDEFKHLSEEEAFEEVFYADDLWSRGDVGSIDLHGLPNLKRLSFKYTPGYLTIRDLPQLEDIFFEEAYMKQFELKNLPKLEILSISGISVGLIYLRNLPNLKELYIVGNKNFQGISWGKSSFPALELIEIRDNQTNFNFEYDYFFAPIHNHLKKLIYHNTMNDMGIAIENLPQLEVVDMKDSGTNLELKNLPMLKEIKCFHQKEGVELRMKNVAEDVRINRTPVTTVLKGFKNLLNENNENNYHSYDDCSCINAAYIILSYPELRAAYFDLSRWLYPYSDPDQSDALHVNLFVEDFCVEEPEEYTAEIHPNILIGLSSIEQFVLHTGVVYDSLYAEYHRNFNKEKFRQYNATELDEIYHNQEKLLDYRNNPNNWYVMPASIPISSFPDSFKYCMNLKDVKLIHHFAEDREIMPEEMEVIINDFPGLLEKMRKELQLLEATPALAEFPTVIIQLEELETLEIRTKSIASIPEEIVQLKKLKKLVLKDNQITHLPASIFSMEQLQLLDIRNNPINPTHLEELINSFGDRVVY